MEENKDSKLCKMCGSEVCCADKKCCESKMCCVNCKKRSSGGVGGGVYGLAFIGALVYFMQTVTTFSGGVMALLKAIIWPALLVYNLLSFLVV